MPSDRTPRMPPRFRFGFILARGATAAPRATAAAAALLLAVSAAACGGGGSSGAAPHPTPSPVPRPEPSPHQRFEQAAHAFNDAYLKMHPIFASHLGYHQYDGRLPDISAKGLSHEAEWLHAQETLFDGIDASTLDDTDTLERGVILSAVRERLFELEVAKSPYKNPLWYNGDLQLDSYIDRDYAPLAERAKAVVSICNGAQAYLTAAEANLPQAMPRSWIATALLQVNGMITFASGDVANAFADLEDPDLAGQVGKSLLACASALTEHRDWLVKHQATASDDYALGEKNFLRMLADTEDLTITLDELQKIGEADLARNTQAFEKAVRAIDPRRPIAAAVARIMSHDKVSADKLLDKARAEATSLRQLIVDKHIVSIPGDQKAEVRLSPPFMRWNFAFLDPPGPFEKKVLPAFYYISPPNSKWPRREQRAYLPSNNVLLFVTTHEVWPGHFVDYLHDKEIESPILRTYCTYARTEGWAHYAEQMMLEEGAGGGDPRAAVGQLSEALLRDVRFLSAIGLHTKGMTVAEAAAMFEKQAYADKATAREQAMRGTFDPGYLNYTLGKLMILKLREDWKAKMGDKYSLQAFHDAFLDKGCGPVPLVRRAMLGPDAGPAL